MLVFFEIRATVAFALFLPKFFEGELAPAGHLSTPVTHRVPRGCELDTKQERQRRFLSRGEQGTLFVLRAEAILEIEQSLICVIQPCQTLQPALKKKIKSL